MSEMISVKCGGYFGNEEPQVFEILSRAEVEKAIAALSHEEIYQAVRSETGRTCSGTAYAYLDVRDGKLKSTWWENNEDNVGEDIMTNSTDSFFKIWLWSITIETRYCSDRSESPSVFDIDYPELLLVGEDEEEEFRTYDGYASDFIREKFGEEELEYREKVALGMERDISNMAIERQIDSLYGDIDS